MAELAYAEVSKTFVPKTCGFDPRCSHQTSQVIYAVTFFCLHTEIVSFLLLFTINLIILRCQSYNSKQFFFCSCIKTKFSNCF